MRILINRLILGALMMCMVGIVQGQTPATLDDNDPGIGGPGLGDAAPDGGPVVPIHGGMSLLIANLGIGYACRKLKQMEANQNKSVV